MVREEHESNRGTTRPVPEFYQSGASPPIEEVSGVQCGAARTSRPRAWRSHCGLAAPPPHVIAPLHVIIFVGNIHSQSPIRPDIEFLRVTLASLEIRSLFQLLRVALTRRAQRVPCHRKTTSIASHGWCTTGNQHDLTAQMASSNFHTPPFESVCPLCVRKHPGPKFLNGGNC